MSAPTPPRAAPAAPRRAPHPKKSHVHLHGPARHTVPVVVRRFLTVLGAAAAALTLWGITGPLAGIEMTADTGGGPTPVGPVAVVTAASVAGLAVWGLLAVLERTTRRPRTVWTWTAAIGLAVSLGGPLTSSASGTAGTLALMAMHLITGAVLIGLLPHRSPR